MSEQKRARAHLDDLLSVDRGLTGREIWWIETINKYWKAKGCFRKKHIKIIYDIYDRRC